MTSILPPPPRFSPQAEPVELHDDISESGYLDVLASHPKVRLDPHGSWVPDRHTEPEEVA